MMSEGGHIPAEGPGVEGCTTQQAWLDLNPDDSSNDDTTADICLFDLPWHDVIFNHILPYLPLQTLFQMRQVCSLSQQLIKEYFSITKHINIARIAGKITREAFVILAYENSNIVSLNLRNAKHWLTDSTLLPVFQMNARLQTLDLTNCTNVTNSVMQAVAVNCPQLTTVMLRDCHWLSSEGLTVIGLNCDRLEKIDLTGCWNINDDSIIILVMNCKRLKSVSLSKIYGLTDNALGILARSCVNLHHLNVQGCWRITDDSVRFLGEYCKQLQVLQIRECHQVTERTLAKLRENKVKMDAHPPPGVYRRIDFLNSGHLRHRLNVQI